MATREDIKNIIAYMALAFHNFHPDVSSPMNSVDVLYDLLGDLSADTLKTAVKSCCAEPGRAFAPSAGEIRGMAVKLHVRAAGVPTAGEAWEEVLRYIADHGSHNGTPEFSNPIITKAVRAIGLVNIGMSEDVMVERAHFLKIYDQLSSRAVEDAAMLPDAVRYIEAQKQIAAGVKMLADKFSPPMKG
jgi:hypothetical protein